MTSASIPLTSFVYYLPYLSSISSMSISEASLSYKIGSPVLLKAIYFRLQLLWMRLSMYSSISMS